jgi:hypothetical protein
MRTRRHHNNNGLRQIKRGKPAVAVRRMAERLGIPFDQGSGAVWAEGGFTYNRVVMQEYTVNNCKIMAGFVSGHPIDTVFLRLEKDGESPTTLLLRPDELQAIAWVAAGAVWSHLMDGLKEGE